MPALYVVAGPNGVGKSTLFNSIIPVGIDYINADLIVKSLKEQSGGNNIQDIANQEVASLFFSKIKKNESFKSFPNRLVLLDNSTGQLELQAENHQGNLHFQNEKISNWAAEILSQESVRSDAFSSIEDVRKNYKPKS
jgi:ABC-type branched-subunit amino acid transport system ATPase component